VASSHGSNKQVNYWIVVDRRWHVERSHHRSF